MKLKRLLCIACAAILLTVQAIYHTRVFAVESEPEAAKEPYRPQYHYTQEANWMNDPNGLVYNEETKEYHMFYQCCKTLEENQNEKYWGHAVSKDLMHWHEYPYAIGPDSLGSIWSGSAVVDRNNTTGFFDDNTAPGARLVAMFTYAGGDTSYGFEKQGIAYSKDNGVTWIKYDGNPVISNAQDGSEIYTGGFRDPKVYWYEDSSYENGGIWLMVAAGGPVRLFTSNDMKDWTFQCVLKYTDGKNIETECPDFYPITVEGTNEQKWILSAAGRGYVVGSLVKKNNRFSFTAETDMMTLMKMPTDMYAAQTFFNDPQGRRVAVYWMLDLSSKSENALEEKKWDGILSLPMEIKLYKDSSGKYELRTSPVDEVKSLRKDMPVFETSNEMVNGLYDKLSDVSGQNLYIDMKVRIESASRLELTVFAGNDEKTVITYSKLSNSVTIIRNASGGFIKENVSANVKPDESGLLHFEIFLDTSVIDIFSESLETSLHGLVYPKADSTGIALNARSGDIYIESLKIYEMENARIAEKVSVKEETPNINNNSFSSADLVLIIVAVLLAVCIIILIFMYLHIRRRKAAK